LVLVKPSGWNALDALKIIPRGPRRIQRVWSCSGAAPPPHMLRARGRAMFTPLTRAKSCPALSLRGRSRCSMRTAATLSLFPSNRGGFDAPQSFFHASMESFIRQFSHEFQSPLPGHPLNLTSFFTSTPVPDTFRSPYTRGPNVDLAQLTASQPATYWIGIR